MLGAVYACAPSCRFRSTTSSLGRGASSTSPASVKFDHRAAQYDDLLDMYEKAAAGKLRDEVNRHIMISTYINTPRITTPACRRRRFAGSSPTSRLPAVTLIAGSGATVAWSAGQPQQRPAGRLHLARHLHLLASWPVAAPGMSVPPALARHGLPIDLQLIGNYFPGGAAARRCAPPVSDRSSPPPSGGFQRWPNPRIPKSSSASDAPSPRRARSSAGLPLPSALG